MTSNKPQVLILRESKPAKRQSRHQPLSNTPLLAERSAKSLKGRVAEEWKPSQYAVDGKGQWKRP